MTIEPRSWTHDDDMALAWSPNAGRATILIDSDGEEALATLVDDGCYDRVSDEDGMPRHYRLPNGVVPDFICAATQAWSASNGHGSVAVFWGHRPDQTESSEPLKGTIWPPPPPPPPVPFGDPGLFLIVMMGHLQMLSVGRHAADSLRAELAPSLSRRATAPATRAPIEARIARAPAMTRVARRGRVRSGR